MYVLGDMARSLPDVVFMGAGIWMAHSFYRSQRKWWQIAGAWTLCVVFCGLAASFLWEYTGMSQMPYERVSMIVGFSCIFAYLYLFTEVPAAQRIFTYFFVDNSMYLLVVLSRYLSVFLLEIIPVSPDLLFLGIYAVLTLAFCTGFANYLKQNMLRGLAVFQHQLTVLSIFAFINYVALLAWIDPWGPMDPLNVLELTRVLLFCAISAGGYYLAFRILLTLRLRMEAEQKEQQMREQMKLTEQYYHNFLDNVDQIRTLRHDVNHHIRTIAGLCAGKEWGQLEDYVNRLTEQSALGELRIWCRHYTVSALLDHYSGVCRSKGIRFECRAAVAPECAVDPIHLCAVLGNALQNAVDACEQMDRKEERFIEVQARERAGKLVIEVRNSFDGFLWEDGEKGFRSRKEEEGHGLGLGSIRRTVELYGGYCSAGGQNGVFSLQAVLKEREVGDGTDIYSA